MARGCMLYLMMVLIMDIGRGEGQLVKKEVSTKFNQTFTTIPGTLPLFFHDCFVTGCDASTMVSSPNGDAEKDAPDNVSLAGDGFDTVVKAKQEVEGETIYLISTPDRDVVVLAGDPSFNVELRRRDGLVSKASLVKGKLPEPRFNLSQLNAIFAVGAHTLGFFNCSHFVNRLYSFSSSSPVDPSLNQDYAKQLMNGCPRNVDPSIAIVMDSITPQTFDNVYFQNLVDGKGLFTSDEVLFTDPASQPTVNDFANSSSDFNGPFATTMRRIGRVRVKTGSQGSIRIDCTVINS